ncbi:energy-coupled thiamine transporter ThiT [Oceanobacillus halotolerans]|uniref:energy-coupled thiamine transporter ThiT n=1 Tax=Oceanobacillus halotolerans TaxID=2663380 RepID=UPI0013DB760A|nr:energy-coupled thiamine transporter ThiT [Oceanobacillus halotolerans]
MSSKRILFLVEVAIFTALALALDLAPFLSFKIWAQGGSISFAMIPIFIVAFRWGLKGGLLSGFLWGVLQLPLGAYILTPLQGFIDYIVAFTVLGLAGIFANQVKKGVEEGNTKKYLSYITYGVLLASTLRFIAHFTAGVVFFESAIDSIESVWVYSLLYNISYMLPSFILSTVIVFFLFHKQPRTLLNAA